jgi:hypothetical protein
MSQRKTKQYRTPKRSILKQNIEDQNFEHNANLNRALDSFSVKLIKIVGFAGVILGLIILIAFWYWVIHWLYQVW